MREPKRAENKLLLNDRPYNLVRKIIFFVEKTNRKCNFLFFPFSQTSRPILMRSKRNTAKENQILFLYRGVNLFLLFFWVTGSYCLNINWFFLEFFYTWNSIVQLPNLGIIMGLTSIMLLSSHSTFLFGRLCLGNLLSVISFQG